MALPVAIEKLIVELSRLPGVGRRSAERMAYDLVEAPQDRIENFVSALSSLATTVGVCEICGYFTDESECLICSRNRDHHAILVVERPMEVIAMEKAGGFRGLYHVLGGHLSPLKGITPSKLRMEQLFSRLRAEEVTELILATSPSVEGDVTALYISRMVERENLNITRLGRGVPMGGSLELSDSGTLRLALESRRPFEGSNR